MARIISGERVWLESFFINKLTLFAAIFVLAILVNSEPGSAQNFHGNFSNNSNLCESCHSGLFGGPGPNGKTQLDLCLNCHDGSFGSGNILSSFGFDGQKYAKISRHKVPEGYLSCSDCHSPHVDTSVSPALLSARGKRVSSGSQFCLVCHGEDPNADGFLLAGDHGTGYLGMAAHDVKLTWTSPSGVKCANCHLAHGSSNDRLVGFRGKGEKSFGEEKLCFACHGSQGPSSLRGWTILDQFILPSHHRLVSSQNKVECASCHNPHFVRPEAGKMMSDPDNTLNLIANANAFCLKCHDGSPPVAQTSTGTVVPFTIKFEDQTGPFFPGWDVSGYVSASSGHYARGYSCLNCHHPHGSRNARLVAFNFDNSPGSGEEKLCLACHKAGGAEGAADITADLQKPYVHPVKSVSGIHTDTEDFSSLSYFETPLSSKRHAECADCHNPHYTSLSSASAPFASGKLGGVGGVNKDGQAVRLIQYEYELCFKCHSSYVILSPGQEDKRSEFNLENASYHPVEETGKNPNIKAGAWVSSWNSGSLVYCSSCHGSDSGSAGVHGSTYAHILRKPYKAEGKNGSDEVCFSCHNYSTYVGDTASPNTRFAAHYLMTAKAGLSCRACHVSHGTSRPHLMTDSYVSGGATRRLNYSHSETGGSCSPSPDSGCHQVKTYTNQY